MSRELGADRAVTAFGPSMPEAVTAELGELVTIRTRDCYDGQLPDSSTLRPGIDMSRFNLASGPIRVRGVAAGDRVGVRIHAIDLDAQGVMALAPGLGVLGDRIDAPSTRILPIRDGRAWLTEDVGVPIRPMIGVIGAATDGDEISTSTPREHGGNLDTKHMQARRMLSLRARADGLLLAVGDLHAVQGDGELGGTGVEIGGRVTLSVEALEEYGELPVLLDRDGLRILASGETLEEAIRAGFAEAVELLARWHRLQWDDAYRLASVVSDAEISQVVNPLRTARIRIPVEWVGGPYRAACGGLDQA